MKPDTSTRVRDYLKQVSRRLALPKGLKQRILADLNTTIAAKLETGMTEEAVLRELGQPETVAAEFNAQMADQIPTRSPLRFLCLAAAILSGLVLIGKLLLNFFVNDLINGMTRSVGIIGGADGPTSIFITAAVSDGFDGGFFFWLAVMIAGIAGFYLLSRKKQKEDSE